ncbi:MAG: helix-turn-helix transcriptional regulator [Ruminococcus sp.]|nr:helix-turn-helix transcriptional regulator [Ruminococcus sp.]
MNLGSNLFNARKKRGLSQEEVAEKLGVSRQTISKWELDETLPDIRQSKKLATIYGLSLDELIEFDIDLKEIQQVIEKTSEEKQQEIDWTKVWGEKYPILTTYQQEVNVNDYIPKIREMLYSLKVSV